MSKAFSLLDLLFESGQISETVYKDAKAGKYKTLGDVVNAPENGQLIDKGDVVVELNLLGSTSESTSSDGTTGSIPL